MSTGGNWKEMYGACQSGDLALVEYHIQRGIDPNYQHPEFMTTALIASLEEGHLEVTRYLLEQGANPLLKEDFGDLTPLSVAKATRNKAAVTMLQSYIKS